MELIVSMAITAVIALFVFQFATSLAKVWRTTETGVSTELDAQIALDQIARDLESAIFQERKGKDASNAEIDLPMLAATALADSDVGQSKRWVGLNKSKRPTTWHFSPAEQRYGWAGTWLRFFAAAPSFNAIGYQIIRREPFGNSTEPRYLLHRTVIRHDNTLAREFDISATGYADGNTTNGLKSPRLDGVLLEDVVDFGVRFYIYDKTPGATDDTPAGLRLIFPADANGDLDDTDTDHLASDLTGNVYGNRYPELVEVFIRVLDDVGADKLLELEEGTSTESYKDIVEQHGHLYRRMVRLPGRF